MAPTDSDTRLERCIDLVRLAACSDSPEALVLAASRQLRRPLVLLDRGGVPLATASQFGVRDPPASALTGAATNPDESPAGWDVIPIERGDERLAFIAVGAGSVGQAEQRTVLDLTLALLGDLLERAALARAVRSERRAALIRRLVTDHAITTVEIRSHAKAAGLTLADFYWPALLVWAVGHPGPRTVSEVNRNLSGQADGSITVALDNTTIALLLPSRRGRAARRDVHRILDQVVHHVCQLGHRNIRVISGERSVVAEGLPASVSELVRLRGCLPDLASEASVVSARSFDLARLLREAVNRRRALAFVHQRLGSLLRHDRDHGTDLTHVLELALDFSGREQAARESHRHRNTFRRHLKQALQLVDADLDSPDDRLALHVAIKLWRATKAPPQRASKAA